MPENFFSFGILGAGLGNRIQELGKSKPLLKLNGKPLLERFFHLLEDQKVADIYCALREELLSPQDKKNLPPGAHYSFVNTESSLHTLCELIQIMGKQKSALFSMADTVLLPKDLRYFIEECYQLPPNYCAILATPHVDDESPLWVKIDQNSHAISFGKEPTSLVTSGMYFLSPQAMEIAEKMLSQGTVKMRNFLGALAQESIPIKTIVVTKTIDVDHPSDLLKAADFLSSS